MGRADYVTRKGSRVFTVAEGYRAALQGCYVSFRSLHEPGSTGGQVGYEARGTELEAGEVDHIEISKRTNGHRAAIGPSDVTGYTLGLSVHDELDRQATLFAISGPMRNSGGRHGGITDEIAVRTTIA